MSSNMIKAYSIAYDTQKIKNLDMEERENAITEWATKLASIQETEDAGAPEESGEFIQGIFAEDIGELQFLDEQPPVIPEQDLEELKNSLREEIQAEMAPVFEEKEAEIIAKAKEQAEAIIENAKHDAEVAKESILKMASAQGYEEGTNRAKTEAERRMAEIEAERIQLEQQYEAKIAELEPAFTNILVELVKKVTGVAYDNHKEVLLYLLETGLGFARKDTYFDVVLSDEDYKKYESLFPKIKEHYKDKYALEFKKDEKMQSGDCKLENENRVIDCGLGVRLGGLLEELSLLG